MPEERIPEERLDGSEALAAGISVIAPLTESQPLATATDDAARTLEPGREAEEEGKTSSGTRSLDLEAAPVKAAPVPMSRARLAVVAAIVTLTMCLGAGSQQALNIALPTIQIELDMKETDLQWIASAYSLTNGCFLLLAGRMADIYGRKLVFLCGIFWLGLWSLIGGFMNNGAALVVTRALAGSGAAMSVPSAIGIIAANFSGKARSTAFAAFSAGAPVGAAFGLVIGGLPTAYSDKTWRPALWILGGLAFSILPVGYFGIPADPYTTTDRRVDWVGAALITVGLIFVQFSISAGETAPQGWKTGYIIALLVVGILLVVAFFLWEAHVIHHTNRPPLMRLALWTRAKGKLASVYMIGCISWMGFSSLLYHATLFYQQVQMTGPVGALLRFIPCSVSGVLCNIIVAKLVSRVPTQPIIMTGIVATGIGSVLLAVAPADVSYWRLPFNSMWLAVMGADFLMATGSIFVAALALPEEQSVAGAVNQTMLQLGGAFGLALTSVIAASYNQKSLDAGVPELDARLNGIHAAFWLGAGCSFTALAIAAVMLRGMGTIGAVKKEQLARPNSSGSPDSAVTDDKHLPLEDVDTSAVKK